jgi:hypothetical protein
MIGTLELSREDASAAYGGSDAVAIAAMSQSSFLGEELP